MGKKKSRSESEEKAMELLERVGIPEQAQNFQDNYLVASSRE